MFMWLVGPIRCSPCWEHAVAISWFPPFPHLAMGIRVTLVREAWLPRSNAKVFTPCSKSQPIEVLTEGLRRGTHLGNENDRLVDANRVSEVEAPHGPVSPSRAQRIREGVCPAYSRSRLQDLQTNERGNALQEWRRPEKWAVSRAGLIRNLREARTGLRFSVLVHPSAAQLLCCG